MTTTTSTVMFTDIVGSTEIAVALGDLRFEPVRRAHDALVSSVVEANGGTVVKGLGDGIMATFSAASDAIAAARSIQQTMHLRNGRVPDVALSVRIGLSVGDVMHDDGDCFGAPVIEASRLCAAARGDQILAAEMVRAMARGRSDAAFALVGPLGLKGLPDPVDVVEIRWEPLPQSTVPLPARLRSDDATFVGRSHELGALSSAYERVRSIAQREVILVCGEPGVGKTTLVSRAVQGWHDVGATVAMGWCEQDLRAPYRPFLEAIGHLVADAPIDILQAHVDRHGAGLLPLAPALPKRLALPDATSTDPETERLLLFSAVADLLARLGEGTPVVLVFDDLHWADAGTASLLRNLAVGTDPARLLVIGTFRDAELTPTHPMGQALAVLRRAKAVTRMRLGGLDRPDVVQLVARWTGTEAGRGSERLAADVVVETGGNAFFVTELIRHLDETGQLDELSEASWSWHAAMPDSIREVLGERVVRLGSAADDLLGAAAVVGMEFDLALLTEITTIGEEKALAILGDAISAALVREVGDIPGRFLFSHALVQHTILANLGPTREARLHRRVAEALERQGHDGSHVAALAHHWLQATRISDGSRARDWAREAGTAALGALAPGDAIAYYRQALLLHDQTPNPDMDIRIDLLIGLGTAERLFGDPEYRDTLLKASRLARRRNDRVRLAAAALANNRGTFSVFGGVDRERVDTLEEAIKGCESEADRALLLATLANELTYSGDYPRRRLLTDQALGTARATGDGTLLLRVMNLIFYSLWIPDTLTERLALTAESRGLAAHVSDPLVLFWAAIADYLNLVQAGRMSEGDPLLLETRALSDRLAQPALQWRAWHTQATRALVAGTPDEAERLARAAQDLGDQAGEPEASVYCKSQIMCVHWQRGSLAELAKGISGKKARGPNATASLCLIFAEGGRRDEAWAHLEQAAAANFDMPRDPAYLTALGLFSEAAIVLGAATPATRLRALLTPFADQFGFDGVTTIGALDHYVGALASILDDHDDGVVRLGRSATLHQRIGAPFFEARSRLQLARALFKRDASGDADAAVDHLDRAVALARPYPAVRRAAARLRADIGSL